MYKVFLLSLFLICSTNVFSQDSITGDVWLKLSEESKLTLIIGYSTGATYGAATAASEAGRIYAPSSKISTDLKTELESEQSKNNWDNFKKITRAAKKHSLRHETQKVVEQMDYLYKEPASRIVPWYLIYALSQDRLDGKDITKDLNGYIERKPWDLTWIIPKK